MIMNKEVQEIVQQVKRNNDTKQYQPILTYSNQKHIIELCNQLNHSLNATQELERESILTQDRYRKMLSNISHDLKTPLTVIKGMLELINIEDKPLESNQMYLDKVNEKVDDVISMINTFFELNKLEAMDTQFQIKSLNLIEVSRKVALSYYDLITKQQLTFDIDVPDGTVNIQGNTQIIERILNNLIQNAIHYGYEGNVIGLRIKETDHDVSLMVWDKGKGIDASNQNMVFERLYTLEDSRSKDYSGSGLGLTITKRLVESLGGRIELQSVPYHYTEFKVIFPKKNV